MNKKKKVSSKNERKIDKMERTRKNIILLTAAFILVAVIGATFAYFTAQIGSGANVDIKANTDTVDALRFEVDEALSLRAGMDNFYNGAGNVEESTKARAILLANNTNNQATYNYYVYLDIEDNDFEYTDGDIPELVLVVKGPDGEYLETLGELTQTQVDIKDTELSTDEDPKTKSVTGFDITTKTGLIRLSDINEVISSMSNEQVTEEWEVTIVFVNFNKEQNKNTNKELNAKLYIQAEERPDITIIADEVKDTSMKVTASIDSKKEIKSIQFKLSDSDEWKNGSEVSTIALDEQTYTSTYTFSGLEKDKKYQINVKAIDNENKETTKSKTEKTIKLYTLTDVCPTGGNFAECVQKLHNDHPLYEETNLYYHDGTTMDYVVDYNTVLTPTGKGKYERKDDIIKEQCDVQHYGVCSDEKPYILDYDNNKTKYTYDAAARKAINDGYLEKIEKSVIDAGDDSYRYAGNNPNNFVCLGEIQDDGSCDNVQNLYRIIGAFPFNKETNEQQTSYSEGMEYRVKLIKSEYITEKELKGTNGTGDGETLSVYLTDLAKVETKTGIHGFYWNTRDNIFSVNDSTRRYLWEYGEQKATLNTTLNEYYLTITMASWQNKIADTTWHIAGIGVGGSSAPKQMYDAEMNNIGLDEHDNVSQTTSQAKIGLMYASDYGFALSNKNNEWLLSFSYFDESFDTNVEYNWLYNGVYEWTISREHESLIAINDNGRIISNPNFETYAVRPVFYLKSSIEYVSGDGSIEHPFTIN